MKSIIGGTEPLRRFRSSSLFLPLSFYGFWFICTQEGNRWWRLWRRRWCELPYSTSWTGVIRCALLGPWNTSRWSRLLLASSTSVVHEIYSIRYSLATISVACFYRLLYYSQTGTPKNRCPYWITYRVEPARVIHSRHLWYCCIILVGVIISTYMYFQKLDSSPSFLSDRRNCPYCSSG